MPQRLTSQDKYSSSCNTSILPLQWPDQKYSCSLVQGATSKCRESCDAVVPGNRDRLSDPRWLKSAPAVAQTVSLRSFPPAFISQRGQIGTAHYKGFHYLHAVPKRRAE